MDKEGLNEFIKNNSGKAVKQIYPEAKKKFNISLPTFYKYFNAINSNTSSSAVDNRDISKDKEQKEDVKTDIKTNVDDIKVEEAPIEKDDTGVTILGSGSDISKDKDNDVNKKEDKNGKEKVETAEIIGIVVDLLDMGYKSGGLMPMSENEREKGYQYSEAIANKRVNISSEDADVYNLAFWLVKSVGIRIPQIVQKLSKPKIPQQAKQEEKQNVSAGYNNMSVSEIMSSLGK